MTPQSPRLSVDVVAIASQPDGHLVTVLSQRQFDPYINRYAIPGVLVVAGESLTESCERALTTKAGITPDNIRLLEQVRVYDSPHRDERGPTLTVAHIAIIEPVDELAAGTKTVPLTKIPRRLPFDHTRIITETVAYAARQLWDDNGRLAKAILGGTFTTPRAATVIADLDPTFNTTNTHRLLTRQPCLAMRSNAPSTGGRAPRLWHFDH